MLKNFIFNSFIQVFKIVYDKAWLDASMTGFLCFRLDMKCERFASCILHTYLYV